MENKPSPLRRFDRASSWLRERLAAPDSQDDAAQVRSRRTRLVLICAIIFLAAFAVRQLHWHDYHLKVGSDLGSLVHRYQKHAKEMLDGEGVLFPRDYARKVNIQWLVYPPGYSIFIAAIYGLFGDSNNRLALAQMILDAAAAALVFLVAAELLPAPGGRLP